MKALLDALRKNRAVAAILGGAAVVVVLALLVSGGGRSGSPGNGTTLADLFAQAGEERHEQMLANLPAWVGPTLREHPSVLEELGITDEHLADWMQSMMRGLLGAEEDRPRVAPVTCNGMVTRDEAEVALGVAELPTSERSIRLTRWGERCTQVLERDPRYFVRIQPGDPEDFRAGHELLGVRGQPVSGVARTALWFGGESAAGGGELGLLAVRHPASVGDLYYRIVIGRPDVDASTLEEIASALAAGALVRFPGVELPPPPEPEFVEVTLERPPPRDLSDMGYVENLLAKEETGEWTREEGLVATLQLFAGEVDGAAVLRHPEMFDTSGTGIIQMAQAYLESGSDAETRAEMARLLDRLVFSTEQLEAMAGIEPVSAVSASQLISLGATTQPLTDCQQFFGDVDLDGYVGPCLEVKAPPELEAAWPGKYRMFVPAPSMPQGHWTEETIQWALEGLVGAANAYEPLGTVWPVNLVLSAVPGGSWSYAYFSDGACSVVITPQIRQSVTLSVSKCLVVPTFVDPTPLRDEEWWKVWWFNGLGVYLSNVAFPSDNIEWRCYVPVDGLASYEMQSTLLTRNCGGGYFFQHLEWLIGWWDGGIHDLIAGLPPTVDLEEHKDALRGFSGMATLLHEFHAMLSDPTILDTSATSLESGEVVIPYEAQALEVEIVGALGVLEDIEAFGALRFHLKPLEDHWSYCLEFDGGAVDVSLRAGGVPGSGDWTTTTASADQTFIVEGQLVVVATALDDERFEIHVGEVVDIPGSTPTCGAEPPSDPPSCPDECEPSHYFRNRGS